MHYLKRDPGFSSVQQWAVQHRQSMEPMIQPLDKHLLTGSPLAVSSITVLTADELATIFAGDCRLVAVAEKIDTRRSTALGDIHWSTLKLLASAFSTWAKATPAATDAGSGVDVGKLTAERDNLRNRLADMMVELAGLRAGAVGSIAGGDDDDEISPEGNTVPPAVNLQGTVDNQQESSPSGGGPEKSLPEGPALWDATVSHFQKRAPLQAGFLVGATLKRCDADTLVVRSSQELPPAVISGLSDSVAAVGLRKRNVQVIVEQSDAKEPKAKPVKATKP